jgi:hypothetical protein
VNGATHTFKLKLTFQGNLAHVQENTAVWDNQKEILDDQAEIRQKIAVADA